MPEADRRCRGASLAASAGEQAGSDRGQLSLCDQFFFGRPERVVEVPAIEVAAP
jgi:hypothetical protein